VPAPDEGAYRSGLGNLDLARGALFPAPTAEEERRGWRPAEESGGRERMTERAEPWTATTSGGGHRRRPTGGWWTVAQGHPPRRPGEPGLLYIAILTTEYTLALPSIIFYEIQCEDIYRMIMAEYFTLCCRGQNIEIFLYLKIE